MLNKKVLTAALATALLAGAATSVQAEIEISGNIALTSDYKFRGVSQSNDDIAVQGGFDIAFENGIYIGTWGSTVDFDVASADGGLNGSLELDYYIGWASDIGDSGFAIDVGYLYYDYPGDDGFEGDYQELYGSLSWNNLAVGVAYSDDYYAETDTFMYYYVDYSLPINDTISIDFHVGYNDLEENGGYLSSDDDSFIDYSVGITASWVAVDWTLAYVGTDLDKEDVFGTDWGDDQLVFTISKSM
ncbi:MAG: hypothetical protein ACJA09_003657 [Alcanivorax sp.]|jgi:uncharacterized protein (TIGR02001 family)